MNWEELPPEGNRIELYRKLSSERLFKQESTVQVVGHEPYLSSLISEIDVSKPVHDRFQERMTTGEVII